MKTQIIGVTEFLNRCDPLLDARSPSEYAQGHIPHAVNLPILDDAMRKRVGITYAQQGRQAAVREGFRVTSSWLPELSLQIEALAIHRCIRVYCWRGGMRSAALAFLADLLGMDSLLLEGGYKFYRRLAHSYFTKPWKLIVLGGMTGSGKTELLHLLRVAGQQVLDLESLAAHKGSVFGHLGQSPQPSTEYFENLIFEQLYGFNPEQVVWVEDESITLGRCFIPRPFFEQMQKAPLVWIERDRESRAKRLTEEYKGHDKNELMTSVDKIARRLGLQKAAQIKQLIAEESFADAALLLLDYYDKTYSLCVSKRDFNKIFRITAPIDVDELTSLIKIKVTEGYN